MFPLPILNGRRFGCTRCGNCCMEPGYVFLTAPEMKTIAAHLDLPVADFQLRFGVQWDPSAEQWQIDATDGNGCPLLDGEGGCTVHAVKPEQCKTFPFWDELLDDQSAWEQAKQFCPGLDREGGQLYTPQQIRRIRRGDDGT